MDVTYSFVDVTCSFVSVTCSFVSVTCSFASVTCSFVGVTCSFVSVTCSFVGVTCSFASVTCSFVMNIATHIQWQKGGGGGQGLANFRQICFDLHITAICIQTQTANFFTRLFTFYNMTFAV